MNRWRTGLTYGSAYCVSYFQICRPQDLSDTGNVVTNDHATTSNQDHFRLSLFSLDKIDSFFELPGNFLKPGFFNFWGYRVRCYEVVSLKGLE